MLLFQLLMKLYRLKVIVLILKFENDNFNINSKLHVIILVTFEVIEIKSYCLKVIIYKS